MAVLVEFATLDLGFGANTSVKHGSCHGLWKQPPRELTSNWRERPEAGPCFGTGVPAFERTVNLDVVKLRL
jgi:hypothetical protein